MIPNKRKVASIRINVEKDELINLIKYDLNARLAFAHYMPIYTQSKLENNYEVQQKCINSIKESIILLFPQPFRKDLLFKKKIQDLINELMDEQIFDMPHYICNELKKLSGTINAFSQYVNSVIQNIELTIIQKNLRFNKKSQKYLLNFKKEINCNINNFIRKLKILDCSMEVDSFFSEDAIINQIKSQNSNCNYPRLAKVQVDKSQISINSNESKINKDENDLSQINPQMYCRSPVHTISPLIHSPIASTMSAERQFQFSNANSNAKICFNEVSS
ncbi:hypothetical protein M9Y10_045519 [Tritrichomonas musculus]|uniref:Uncharacterized protein n=1 Tax=Tritrichomonas musculus TaxID=1915356 RepID=A0ABR2JYE1_9EUKA